MHIGKAVAIFSQINSDKYTELEKAEAIYQVAEMPTHNSITKREMLAVIKWLWNKRYEFDTKNEQQEQQPEPNWKKSLMKRFAKVE